MVRGKFPERIVMSLTNSGTEVISKSSIAELSFADLVGLFRRKVI